MAIRLKTSFKNIGGTLYVIEIHDKKYAGAEISFISGGEGFVLNYEGGDDRIYNPILSSQISIPIHIRDDNRSAIESFLSDVTTAGDETRFTIVVYENGYTFWKGKIQPERTTIPDNYYTQITIQGNDGFGRLRSIPYATTAGVLYTDWKTVKEQLFNILEKLDLFTFGIAPIYSMGIMTDWRVGTEQGQIFEKIRFQADALLDISSDGTILPISCHDALTQILTRFHLRIVQSKGQFFIQNFSYLAENSSKNTEYYDAIGDWSYTGSGVTYNTAILQKLAGGARTFREPGKTAMVQYAYQESIGGSNLLTEQIQRSVPFSLGDIPSGNGEVFLFQLKYILQHQKGGTVPMLYSIQHEFFVSRGSYYLSNAGGEMVWTTSNASRVIIDSTRRIKDTSTESFIDQIAFMAAEVPASGEVVITWNWSTVEWVDKTPVTPEGTDTLSILDNIAVIIYAVGDQNEGTLVTIASNQNTSGEQIEIEPLVIGDLPFLRSIGRLQYYDFTAAEWINTNSNWGIGSNESLNIDKLFARELIAFQRNALIFWNRILRQPYSAEVKLNNEVMQRATFTANQGIWQIDTFIPEINRLDISYTNYSDSGDSIGGLPGGVTVPPAPVETHERLHALDSSDDHELIPLADRDKYLWSDLATGKITFVDIQPHTHSEYDNYVNWRILIDGIVHRILKEGGTPTGTSYDGVNFEAGTGITLTASSPVQGNLNVKIEATGGGSGTVTSVGLTAPNIFTSPVSGSPVETSGTLALALATQSANRVWAGPTSGAAAQPAFRSLVAADIPALSYDNYANWRVTADSEAVAYISKNGGTASPPYYDGIKFISGPGITVTPASGINGFLNVEIEATVGGSATSVLGADVSITAASTWTNSGLSITFPSSGVYHVTAHITLKRATTAASAILACRLMNGLDTFASTEQQHESATVQRTSMSLHAIIEVRDGQPSSVALQAWASITGWSMAASTPSSGVPAATVLSIIKLT